MAVNTPQKLTFIAAALVGALEFTSAEAQQSLQVPIPKSASEVSGPVSGTLMTKEYVQMVGRTAYFWGYPIVATSSRRDAFAKAPERIYLGGFLPMAPIGELTMLHDYISPEQTFIVCPNQDVVYGGGFAALDKEPMVFQVPDFGKRFWVYPIYDNRTDEIGRIGQQYGTKPGFYMIVGPNWEGKIPEGITAIVRSPTDLAFPIPRIQMDDTAEDKQAIQAPLSQVMFYPLSHVNVPPEAVYFYNDNDSGGTQMNGHNLYAVTFAKDQLPPVKGFWSLTLYNDRHLFNPNPLLRYSLGTKNKTLQYNPDGSLTLYAGATSPGKDKEANWLPAPNGAFSLFLRGYWADTAMLDGSWTPPTIEMVK